MNLKTVMQRLKNPGTIIAIASGVLLILSNLGYVVDNVKIMSFINSICAIGVALGVLNNPDTPGVDVPGINK